MKNITFIFILSVLCLSFASKDRSELLARKWLMTGMQVEGSTISEEMLERQRRSGLVSILEFRKGGSCFVHLKTPKGKTTKTNKWQLSEDQNKLTIQPDGEPAQVFTIEKVSAKKMTLSIYDNGSKQFFSYKSIKD